MAGPGRAGQGRNHMVGPMVEPSRSSLHSTQSLYRLLSVDNCKERLATKSQVDIPCNDTLDMKAKTFPAQYNMCRRSELEDTYAALYYYTR